MTVLGAHWHNHRSLVLGGLALVTPILAWLSEGLWDLRPCPLCLDQRAAWYGAGGAWLLAWATRRWRWGSRVLYALGVLSVLVGMGLAGYHVGVEQGWWSSGCAASGATKQDLESLRAELMAQPVVLCHEIPIRLWGLSLAAWNGIWSLLVLVLAVRRGRQDG